MPPTTAPITSTMIGSMEAVSDSAAESTSLS